MQATVAAYPELAVPADLRAQVQGLYRADSWHFAHDTMLHPVSMLLIAEGRVLAALDILSKHIFHHGESFAACGLSRVITDPGERRKGYGRRLVRAARDFMAASGADLGIFTCDRPLTRLYEGCGWQILPGTVLVGGTRDQPFASDQFDKVTLATFFSLKAQLHAQSFVGTRVDLYSGDIDRLW